MRHRATFLAGLAVGLVAGARAGRERYDQVKKLTQKVVDSPTVRKATKSVTHKAGELTKAASHQAADKLPKLTESAKNSASKIRRNHDDAFDTDHAPVNGTRPAS
jgi:hypothetical protein